MTADGTPIASPPDSLATALSLAGIGWPVFPVRLTPVTRADGSRAVDKRPLVKWLEGATLDREQIATWWGQWPDAWVGVHAGRAGIVIVDVDIAKGDRPDGAVELEKAGIKLPKTLRYRTRSGGRHHVYAAPEGVKLTIAQNVPVPGVDLRAGNGLMVYYGPPLTEAPTLSPAPEWATVLPEKTYERGEGSIDTWLERVQSGKPSKALRAVLERVTSDGMSHDDMLAVVSDLVKLGAERGSRTAFDRARDTYLDGWQGFERHWDAAASGSIAQHGIPPVTLPIRPLRPLEAKPPKVAMTEGAAVLDEVRRSLERFVAFPSPEAAVAATLWAAHTHLIAVFENTPRLAFLSPEPGSGKSRALEVLSKVVADAVWTTNMTTAYLARKISASDPPPTVLFDEVDALFGTRARDASADELRGILNGGYRRGAMYGRAAIRGKEVVTEEHETFAPVALAGLGELPDTIMTRSVVVKMRRRAPDEVVEPYRERTNGPELERVRGRLAGWARSARKSIGAPWPDLPEGIADRDADIWEPLLAVADAAGGHWPATAREAAVDLVTDSRRRPATLGVRLLADVRRVLGDRDRIGTSDLLGGLIGLDDAPWGDLGGRGAIDGRYLGKTFAGYGISHAHTIRFDPSRAGTARGWDRGDFADAWLRYLPDEPTLTTL